MMIMCVMPPGVPLPLEKKKSGGRVQTLISQNKFKFLNFLLDPHTLYLWFTNE